jgi:tryptophan-rich sensory protein
VGEIAQEEIAGRRKWVLNEIESMNRSKQFFGLLVSLILVFGAASLGRFFTDMSVSTWYPGLIKPSWTPTGATIGIVWTILYACMALAAWLVWRTGGHVDRRLPLALYFAQLILNVLWSAIFFGLQKPGLAFLELLVLWIAVLVTTIVFRRYSSWAGVLMLPYLAWVAFAGYLNAMIWRMNP